MPSQTTDVNKDRKDIKHDTSSRNHFFKNGSADEHSKRLRHVNSYIFKLLVELDTETQTEVIPGASVAIVDVNGKEPQITYHSYGKVGLGKDAATIDQNTVFEIGSVTKAFTGLALAILVEKGIVGLDDRIAKYAEYFPGLANNKVGNITLKQLALHDSGLPMATPKQDAAWSKINELQRSSKPIDDQKSFNTLESTIGDLSGESDFEFIQFLNRIKPEDLNGGYSNVGFGILGYILVKASGASSFDDLLNRFIKKELGMNSTLAEFKEAKEVKFAHPHLVQSMVDSSLSREIAKQVFGPMDEGAGALVSTTKDLSDFVVAQLAPAKCGKLRAAIEIQQSALGSVQQRNKYEGFNTLGMTAVQTSPKSAVLLKDGSTMGSGAIVMWNNELGLGIIVLANTPFPPSVKDLTEKLMYAMVATPEDIVRHQMERQYLQTYKARNFDGENTSESEMVKQALRL